MEGCRVFAKPLFITRVGSHPIMGEGALVYDEARSRCGQGEKVQLFAKGISQPLSADCPGELSVRQTPLAVFGVPE
jgi:hypothetical protein